MAASSQKCSSLAGLSPEHHVEHLAGYHYGPLLGFQQRSVSLCRQDVTAVLLRMAGKEHQRDQRSLRFHCLQEQQGGSPSHDIGRHKSQGMLVPSNFTYIPLATPTRCLTLLSCEAQ